MIKISLVLLICTLSRTIKGQVRDFCEEDKDCRTQDAKSCVKFSGCSFGACICPIGWAEPNGVCTEPVTIIDDGEVCSSKQPSVTSCGPKNLCVACPNQAEYRCRSVVACNSDDNCPLGNACLKFSGCSTVNCTCPLSRQDRKGKCLEPSTILEKGNNCTRNSKTEICNTRKLYACLPCFNDEPFKCRKVIGAWTSQPTSTPAHVPVTETPSSAHEAIGGSMLLVLSLIIQSLAI